ncbi:tripartite tricarboxylate transporter substrate binding protein [Achromobacter aloeverae]|uniref:Twin-arginine translocation pathway signal n=1 Tax=Achromobacter aloeverae TaxID=1750518 RepID=A0A4Q1HM63_9BURK|nr:tripartite tricarboxylate transporter substrate binding protein [Achromobacter aloeverae]RXN91583.1 twin-arginine translocation pathway signal [Achromobacter aloeverae]
MTAPTARASTPPHRHAAHLCLTLALMATTMAAAPARAQDGYPARPITMIVPFGPGGTSDIMARILQKSLTETLGKGVVIENRAGAGGAIGMSELARAPHDGYTIGLSVVGPEAIQPVIRKTGYTPDSYDHLCGTYDVPLMMMVKAGSPWRRLQDVLDAARREPGKINYGSSGTGTVLHLSMQGLMDAAGASALHVPYKSSGEMVTGLMGGQIDVFDETPTVSRQYKLRPLALFSDTRLAAYPDVPTVKELGYPITFSVWGGLIAPKGLPASVRAKLESACDKAVHTAAYQEAAAKLDTPLVYKTGADFEAFVKAEYGRYGAIVRKAGLDKE